MKAAKLLQLMHITNFLHVNNVYSTVKQVGSVTYKNRKPYCANGRDMDITSDVPQLIKTTCNC